MHTRSSYNIFLALFVCLMVFPFAVSAEQSAEKKESAQPESVATQPAVQPEAAPVRQEPTAQPKEQTQPAKPEEKQAPKVIKIDVRGNKVVNTQTILSKIKTQAGSEIAQNTINEDVKRLYATGFFQDIRMDIEEETDGVHLVVTVDEKPIVKKIILEGNQLVKEKDLRKDLNIIEGQVLDEFSVKQGLEKIKERYSNKGFKFVDISDRVEIDPATKEATITITIKEGQKFVIGGVKFAGVKAVKERQLRKLMKTKKRNVMLLRFGVFKEDQFKEDLERVNAFYQSRGYLDAKVSHDVEYQKDSKKILITIQIEEGDQYHTGRMALHGVKVFPENEIWRRLKMLPSLIYSQQALAEDIKAIRDFYYERGYMDVRVLPDVKVDEKTRKVDVNYEIQEGDLYFVDKVQIRGNTKTKDMVIRRELRIRPGEKFDGTAIERSKKRLEDLGYFEEVTYDTEQGSAPNRKDVVWRVKEKRTGELSFGAGISSIDQFVGFAEIAQRNFDLLNWPRLTGGGQTVSLRGRWGTITRDFGFSFVEPYLLNRPISFGLDLYDNRTEDRNVDFREERLGGGITFSKAFTEFLRLGVGYRIENVNVFDVSSDASSDVTDFEGKHWLSRLKTFSSYDKRDSVTNPTKGWLAGLSAELIGTFLGGAEDYYMLEGNYTKYWSFSEGKQVVEWRNRLGYGSAFGDPLPIFDRFFAGGLGTVRGFNYRRVGPIEGGSAIGGSSMAITNLEYTFPMPYIEIVKGAIFTDAGNITRDAFDFDFSHIQTSVGPGLKVKTPLGPFALYYGFPIMNRDTEDKNGRFEFSLSRGF